MKVKYCSLGLASNYGDRIEINKNLKQDKTLRDYIMKHELGHSNKFDLHYEVADGVKLISKPLICYLLVRFIVKNPSTWIDFLPVQMKNRKIVYDLNLTLLYAFIIGLTAVMFKIF